MRGDTFRAMHESQIYTLRLKKNSIQLRWITMDPASRKMKKKMAATRTMELQPQALMAS